jgi:hypothetical protein
MLAEQQYGGHASIHDEGIAGQLGFSGAPIEGPTHFSQFDPLLGILWGKAWFEHGTLSVHFQQVVVEGEEVQASVEVDAGGATSVALRAEKADGSPVLTGTAHLGDPGDASECRRRLAQARRPERLHILDRLAIGLRGASSETVQMSFESSCGDLYPFSLAQKLASITEPLAWYTSEGAAASPWKRPIIPMEMISVLAYCSVGEAGFDVRQPSVAMFLDEEIELVRGPLFVDEPYRIDREIVGLSESRRTESYWLRSVIRRPADEETLAVVLLHIGVLKESYHPPASGSQGEDHA